MTLLVAWCHCDGDERGWPRPGMGHISMRGGPQVSFLSLKHLQPKWVRQTKGGEGNQAAEAYKPYDTWGNVGCACFREQQGRRVKQWCSWLAAELQHPILMLWQWIVELNMCPSKWTSSGWIPPSCLSMDFHADLKWKTRSPVLAILSCAQNTHSKIELSSTLGLLGSCWPGLFLKPGH